jgi:hypothetical protein
MIKDTNSHRPFDVLTYRKCPTSVTLCLELHRYSLLAQTKESFAFQRGALYVALEYLAVCFTPATFCRMSLPTKLSRIRAHRCSIVTLDYDSIEFKVSNGNISSALLTAQLITHHLSNFKGTRQRSCKYALLWVQIHKRVAQTCDPGSITSQSCPLPHDHLIT